MKKTNKTDRSHTIKTVNLSMLLLFVLHYFTIFSYVYNRIKYIELSTYCLTNTHVSNTICGQHIWKPVLCIRTQQSRNSWFAFWMFILCCFVFRAYMLENIYNTWSRWLRLRSVWVCFWALCGGQKQAVRNSLLHIIMTTAFNNKIKNIICMQHTYRSCLAVSRTVQNT